MALSLSLLFLLASPLSWKRKLNEPNGTFLMPNPEADLSPLLSSLLSLIDLLPSLSVSSVGFEDKWLPLIPG